jgi:hypothetical protein
MAATSLVVLALASAPANAHHGHNYVAPLAAFIAFNALFHHNHHNRHRHYGHGGHGGHQGHKHHRRHSHSHGGYHKPRRKHYRNW